LWFAAENGMIEVVKSVLKNKGVDVNASNANDEGWTALHYASNEGHESIVECLIRDFNAEVNCMSLRGRTPLHIACNRLNKKVIERLLLAGADANIQQTCDGNTPMHIAAKYS